MNRYISKQINQIAAEGFPALFRKLKRLFFLPIELLLIILALSLVIIIRALRPFVIIRIGELDLGRIAHIYDGDWYLSEKTAGNYKERFIDWYYFFKTTKHANKQWERMWKRVLPYLPGIKLWKYMMLLNKLFPGYKRHKIPSNQVYPDLKTWQKLLKNPDKREINVFNKKLIAVLNNTRPNITFTNQEVVKGQTFLEDLGIHNNEQYICFHARDSAYLDSVLKTKDWSYHNYRDSNINNYLLAAEEMANRGYYALRMGALVKGKIQSSHPKVLDYATNGKRTDFNDIFLSSNCRFFLCSDTGISVIPEVFRIPVVYVNWAPILRISTWVLNGLFIFKKFYLKNENRYMSFLEIMNLDFGGIDTNRTFTNLNIELIENTPDEIRAVTVEMNERLNGTWQTTKDDEKLQKSFWALFGLDKVKSPNLRIGSDFLRQHKELIH